MANPVTVVREEPEALTADGLPDGTKKLDGAERIRLGRRMMVDGERTGKIRVWSTSILEIIKYARKISPTVKLIARSAAGNLVYTTTDGKETDIGSIVGPPGASVKGDKGDKGDKGESIKGDPGASVKGDKGDKGDSIKGDPGASIKGDKGDTGPSALIDMGIVTITQTATLVAIALGPRVVTITGLTGLLKNDFLVVTPIDPFPVGYLMGQPISRANGTVDFPIYGPLLALNASYTIKARLGILR